MNWGAKIVLGLGAFMVFIICSVVYMVSKDSDTLIDEDYYEKSLVYDEVYDRKQNLQNDHAKPTIQIQQDTLVVTFKDAGVKGNISFKRPSDGSLDKTIPLFTATNIFKLPVATFLSGNWLLELSWESNNQKYIDNQSVFIH